MSDDLPDASSLAHRSGRLYGIEALRGLAAVGVVFSHTARHLDKIFQAPGLIRVFQAGHAGVDLFFVISGFIILHVHRSDIGRPDRLTHYAGRRLNRVFPLYWVALALTVAMTALNHAPPSLAHLLWSAALLPSVREPVLGIAWTLEFEMVFYAIFAVLIVNLRAGLALLLLWQTVSALQAAGVTALAMPSALGSVYSLEFLLGLSAAWLLRGVRVRRPGLLAGVAALAFGAAYLMESAGLLYGYGVAARLAYGLPACLLILGLAAAERDGRLAVPGWLRGIGQASYSIYLFQFVFIGTLWQMLLSSGAAASAPRALLFVLLAAAALAGGVAMSRLVEQPLLQLTRANWRTSVPKRA